MHKIKVEKPGSCLPVLSSVIPCLVSKTTEQNWVEFYMGGLHQNFYSYLSSIQILLYIKGKR